MYLLPRLLDVDEFNLSELRRRIGPKTARWKNPATAASNSPAADPFLAANLFSQSFGLSAALAWNFFLVGLFPRLGPLATFPQS